MKIQRYVHIALILLVCMITLSAVSAADDSASDIISADDNEPIIEENINNDAPTGTNDNEQTIEENINNDAPTGTNDKQPTIEENINKDVSISSNNNEELIFEDLDIDEIDDVANEKPALAEGQSPSLYDEGENPYENAEFHVNDVTTEYGSGAKLLFNLTKDGVNLDDVPVSIDIRYEYIDLIEFYDGNTGPNGGWTINLNPGRYQAVLILEGHPEVEHAYATITVTAKFHPIHKTVNLSIGDTYSVEYELEPNDDDQDYELSFKSNDTNIVTVNSSTGKAKALKEGNATITVHLNDKRSFHGFDIKVNIKVGKRPTQLIAKDVTTTYNVNKDLVITLKDNKGNAINGTEVTVNLNGNKKYTTDKNGQIKVAIGKLTPKTYTAKISYAGDEQHNSSSTTVKVTVNKIATKLTATKVSTTYNVNKNLVITLKDNKGNAMSGVQITVNLGGNKKYKTNKNGQVKVATGKLIPKTYTAKISYAGNTYYKAASTTARVTVNKLSPKLTATKVSTTYNVNKYLVITLKNNKGNAMSGVQITVNLGGNKKYKTNKNGQVKVATGKLVPKAYNAKIRFAGNTYYKAASTTTKVTVKKASPKLTANAKAFKFEDKTKKYAIVLKNNRGNALKNAKVSIKINGKTYAAKTNAKGVATFKLTKLNKKGNFNAAISYAGDKYYNKVAKKAKITVKAPAWKTVAKGSNDKVTVRKIQKALKDNGYYISYKGRMLKVDGIFESCTERSVKEFQRDKKLKVSGKVDYTTAKKLKIVS